MAIKGNSVSYTANVPVAMGAPVEIRPEKHQNLQQGLSHITTAVDEVQRVLARVRGEPWGMMDVPSTPQMGLAHTLDTLPEQMTEQAKRLAELVAQLEQALF